MAKRITSLLLVVLLLAGVVPTALAGAASADEIAALEPVDAEPEVTEVSTAPETTEEPTAPEVTEPATEPEETDASAEPEATEPEPLEEFSDPLDDPENLQFQIDTGVYETYILEHMDLALVGSGDTLTPYDLISVKQTLVSGEKLDALGGSHTIDGLWADDDGDGLSDYADALLIQKSTDVYLYQVSEDADYLVGYVDTLNASNYRVEDYLFAENTSEGNLISGCIYDEETGLVYVPVSESIREDEEGLLLIGRVQIQLLYVSAAQIPIAAAFSAAAYESTSSSLFSSAIRVEVIQPDKETSAVRTVSVSLMDTYISLKVEIGDSYIDYVTINGCPIERTDWEYTDGTLLIAQQPASSIGEVAGQILGSLFLMDETTQVGLKIIFFLLIFAYCVIKIFFANIKRGGIILVQMAVGSLYMFSVPRGYTDGFYQWCKQTIAICLTAFLQTTLLFLGMLTFKDNMLLGLGVMLAANEVPRIAQQFGLDSSVRVNASSVIYSTSSAVNLARTVFKPKAA